MSYNFHGRDLYHKSKIMIIFSISLFKPKLVDNYFKIEFELWKSRLTLLTSQTFTVLSAEDVATHNMLGQNLTSVIRWVCSSSVDFRLNNFVHQIEACTT